MLTRIIALNAQYMHVSLSLRLLALSAGGRAETWEGNINLPFHFLLENALRAHPRAVGFSVYIWNAELVWRLCRAIRAHDPNTVIFAGGPEVQTEPEAALREHPELDYVLSGECEGMLGDFLTALERGEGVQNVPGVAWRVDGVTRVNAPAQSLAPALWPDVWANGLEGLENRILYVETSRGCPYRCKYCLSGSAGAVRALDAVEAVRRLTHMAEAGAKLIKLVDRTFNFDRARANAIWRSLIEHSARTGLTPTYHFEIGAHLLDEEAFAVLADAPKGLFQFEAGIQSTDARVLAGAGRTTPFEALRGPLCRVKALGTIHLHVDLIAGLPKATMATFEKSFDDAYGIAAEMLQLGFLKVLPGSAFRKEAEALGLRYAPDAPYEILSTPHITFDELCHLKDVERVLDWYAASGYYVLTMRWLLEKRTPFRLFSDLAHALRADGVFDADRGEKARATALLSVVDCPEIRCLMRCDLVSCGRRKDLPPSLAFTENAAQRAALRERYHPVRGQSAVPCAYDAEAYRAGAPLIKRDCIAFYG